jgi:hypothetical protein
VTWQAFVINHGSVLYDIKKIYVCCLLCWRLSQCETKEGVRLLFYTDAEKKKEKAEEGFPLTQEREKEDLQKSQKVGREIEEEEKERKERGKSFLYVGFQKSCSSQKKKLLRVGVERVETPPMDGKDCPNQGNNYQVR